MSDDKILERVRKLLRLATSDNVNEAANAAAQAQALIDRHRLDGWARVELAGDPFSEMSIVDASDRPLDESKRLRKWKIFLAGRLAPVHGCRVYILEPTPPAKLRRLVPVGRAEDVELFAEIYRFLVTQIECLTRSHGQSHDRKWCEGFRVGAAKTIVSRLHADQRDRLDRANEAVADTQAPAPPSGNAGSAHLPVPVSRRFRERLARVDEFLQQKPDLESGRALRVDARGFAYGEIIGNDIDLPSR